MLLIEVLPLEVMVENLEVSLLSKAWSCSCVTRLDGVIWTTLSMILSVVGFVVCVGDGVETVDCGVGVVVRGVVVVVVGEVLTSTRV